MILVYHYLTTVILILEKDCLLKDIIQTKTSVHYYLYIYIYIDIFINAPKYTLQYVMHAHFFLMCDPDETRFLV